MLFFFAGVKERVIIGASQDLMLYLLPVGCLIIITDEASNRHVVRKLDNGVGSMHRSAVVGEDGVEDSAHSPVVCLC